MPPPTLSLLPLTAPPSLQNPFDPFSSPVLTSECSPTEYIPQHRTQETTTHPYSTKQPHQSFIPSPPCSPFNSHSPTNPTTSVSPRRSHTPTIPQTCKTRLLTVQPTARTPTQLPMEVLSLAHKIFVAPSVHLTPPVAARLNCLHIPPCPQV